MNTNALFKISYGLYVLIAKENDFDNGCIINTFSQVTNTPNRVAVVVNKTNKTADGSYRKRAGSSSGTDCCIR